MNLRLNKLMKTISNFNEVIMTRWIHFFGVLFVLLSIGCDINNSETVNEITDMILFDFSESYSTEEPSNPSIMLSMRTSESYPCINYQIVSNVSVHNSEITMIISGVLINDFCLDAIGPATKRHFLDLENGNYKLKIVHNKKSAEYAVSITTEAIEIEEVINNSNGNNIHFSTNHRVYYRYPENSFAFIGGTNTTNTIIYENLLDSLKTKFQISEFSFPKDGNIPYPNSAQGHYVDYPSVYFKYQTDDEYQRIGEYIIYYSGKYIYSDTGITIYTINWKNERFMSWLHDIE